MSFYILREKSGGGIAFTLYSSGLNDRISLDLHRKSARQSVPILQRKPIYFEATSADRDLLVIVSPPRAIDNEPSSCGVCHNTDSFCSHLADIPELQRRSERVVGVEARISLQPFVTVCKLFSERNGYGRARFYCIKKEKKNLRREIRESENLISYNSALLRES